MRLSSFSNTLDITQGRIKRSGQVTHLSLQPSLLSAMSAPQPIPDVQKAWVSVRKGTPSRSLEFREEWPVKKLLAPGEVLVKVQAAALNPVFVFFYRLEMFMLTLENGDRGHKLMGLLPNFLANRPYVPESDFSGTIVDSNDSKEFKAGDEVFGWIEFRQFLQLRAPFFLGKPSTGVDSF